MENERKMIYKSLGPRSKFPVSSPIAGSTAITFGEQILSFSIVTFDKVCTSWVVFCAEGKSFFSPEQRSSSHRDRGDGGKLLLLTVAIVVVVTTIFFKISSSSASKFRLLATIRFSIMEPRMAGSF
uniref:Uncharacterized protein n=1 Tax=Romanomermis culicivorax TaxID=13658 RepID=A0A915HRM8_ROMCU